MDGAPTPRPPRAIPAGKIKPLTIQRRPRLLVAFAAREALMRSKERRLVERLRESIWRLPCPSLLSGTSGRLNVRVFQSIRCSQQEMQLPWQPACGKRYHGKSRNFKVQIAICCEPLVASRVIAIRAAGHHALLRGRALP